MKAGFSFFARLKKMTDATQSELHAAHMQVLQHQNILRAAMHATKKLDMSAQEHTPHVSSHSWNWELAFGVGCGAHTRHQLGRYKQ